MSTLDKMLIKGIRSFSPDNTHVITFYRPLTLVVGPNGAGKTTIIECLKNACTGELPPNARSGQSFIHDPKIEGQTETKGQIKLRFKTAAAKDVVCIRSFQLTQKATKMEYKAIESVLQTINSQTGEKVCLSYRCADMDREVPALMGVSKAILENVIFVHQDEANWPLSEASVLKKKFDDIFSATKYTKALEVIKKLHKEQAQEIKLQKLQLENLQTVKDQASKLQASIRNDQQLAENLQSKIAIMEPQIEDMQKKISEVEEVLRQIRQCDNDIAYKEGQKVKLVELREVQFAALEEEIEDSDEMLAEFHAKFQEKIENSNRERVEFEHSLNTANTQYETLSELITRASSEVGKFESEENAHKQERKQFEAVIQQLFGRYKLGNVVLPLDEQTTEICIAKITKRLEDLKQDHAQLRTFHEKELSKLSAKLDETNKSYSDARGSRDAKIAHKSAIEGRLEKLSRDMGDMSSVEADLKRSEERLASMENEVKKITRRMEEMHYEEDINEERMKKTAIENKILSLRMEKGSLDREADERRSLRLKRDELESQQRNLKRLMDDNKDKFRQLLKSQPRDPKSVKSDVDNVYSSIVKAHDELSNKSRDADMRVAHARAMLDDAKAKLSKQQAERDAKKRLLLNRLSSLLQESLDLETYPSRLRSALELKDNKKSQHDMADGMRRMFDPFIQVARKNHICPCCERAFTPEEEDDFVRKQRTKSSNTSERLQALASQYNLAENTYQQLEKLRPVYEEYQKLVNELIPDTEKLIPELTQEFQRSTEAQDDVSCLWAQSKAELKIAQDLRFAAQSIDTTCQTIQNLEDEVRSLEEQLNPFSSSLRSADDVGLELQRQEKQLEEVNRRIDKLREEQDYMKDDLNTCTKRKLVEEARKAQLLAQLERSRANKEEAESHLKEIEQLDYNIQLDTERLAPLQKEREMQMRELEQLRMKFKEEQDASAQAVAELDKEIHSLLQLRRKIKTYVELRKTENLENAKRKLSELQARKDEEERKRAFYLEELGKIQKVIASQKEFERNLLDNIAYRKTLSTLDNMVNEINSIEEEKLKFGNVEEWQSKLNRLQKEKQLLIGEVSGYKGTLAVHENNIRNNKAEFKHAQYKNIDKRYRAQLIKLKTLEMANKDLDKYYGALDRALMRFHTMKMEEINKIIKELWQQTYRGQDIDYIEIRADSEGASSRSYSYRVIMRSGDAELEMRGRCSAGQKVLAALIIRLALAETFCLNCGILTLDEPTTNLDAANSESFAAALLRIMEDRRGQENFQLIVITHDERFAQLIGQRQLAEKYYRVSKDEKQHSLIETQDIFS